MAKKLNKLCEYFHSTPLYDCPKCGAKLRDYMAELRAKVEAVPKERKQQFLDYLKEGNVGQAVERIDPSKEVGNEVWYQIVANQIETRGYKTFNFTAK